MGKNEKTKGAARKLFQLFFCARTQNKTKQNKTEKYQTKKILIRGEKNT